MSDFHYADRGDKLTDALISENFDGAYWERSETRLLEQARAYISRKFGHEAQKKLRMLDLGCGMGRLIPDFAALYGSVLGLEPDEERSAQARDYLAYMGVKNAEVFHGSLEDYLAERQEAPVFDVVLCSHVFQHISHDTVSSILRDLGRCTGEQTVFIFTTTYTWGEENDYTAEEFREGERVSSVIDHAGFEAAVRAGTSLPVCRFARPWLEKELGRFGLTVRDFSCYHFFGEHNAENDPMNTGDPEKRKLARDAFYLCERGGGEKALSGESLAEGKITFLQYYYLKDGEKDLKGLPPEHTKDNVGPYGSKVLEDLGISQGFLYGAGLHFPAKRYVTEDLGLSREGLPIRASHAILSVYPKSSVCQVSVCLCLEETAVRNLIWLHQIQTSDGTFFQRAGGEISIPGLCKEMLEKYGLRSAVSSSTAVITEVNRLEGCHDAEKLSDDVSRCLYGVMSGDEGWQHVPAKMARERMKQKWSSRKFVRVVAFDGNFLVLNLNRQEQYRDYLATQSLFADRYWGGHEPVLYPGRGYGGDQPRGILFRGNGNGDADPGGPLPPQQAGGAAQRRPHPEPGDQGQQALPGGSDPGHEPGGKGVHHRAGGAGRPGAPVPGYLQAHREHPQPAGAGGIGYGTHVSDQHEQHGEPADHHRTPAGGGPGGPGGHLQVRRRPGW